MRPSCRLERPRMVTGPREGGEGGSRRRTGGDLTLPIYSGAAAPLSAGSICSHSLLFLPFLSSSLFLSLPSNLLLFLLFTFSFFFVVFFSSHPPPPLLYLGSLSSSPPSLSLLPLFFFSFSIFSHHLSTQERTLTDVLLAVSNPARRIIFERTEEERRVDMAQTILYIQEKMKVYWNLPPEIAGSLSRALELKFQLLHRLQQALTAIKRQGLASSEHTSPGLT